MEALQLARAVRRRLAASLGLAVVGEEHGGLAPEDGSAYWLVDPICGTRNFASGVPLYSVNLALVESGSVAVAMVGEPGTDAILVAERGRGALLAMEAGATVSDIDGSPWTLESDSLLAAATPRTHEALLALLSETRR